MTGIFRSLKNLTVLLPKKETRLSARFFSSDCNSWPFVGAPRKATKPASQTAGHCFSWIHLCRTYLFPTLFEKLQTLVPGTKNTKIQWICLSVSWGFRWGWSPSELGLSARGEGDCVLLAIQAEEKAASTAEVLTLRMGSEDLRGIHKHFLFSTLLYYINIYVLIILYYIILYYIILCYIILCYVMLYYIMLHYIMLDYINYIKLHYITLHYTTLHYTILYFTILYCIISRFYHDHFFSCSFYLFFMSRWSSSSRRRSMLFSATMPETVHPRPVKIIEQQKLENLQMPTNWMVNGGYIY